MTNPHHGQKVTTDPESTQKPIQEGVGVVTSDSLAGESLKHDGTFGEGNPKAAVSEQPSSSTTTNNTDTSGAKKLDPAVDAQAREAQDGWTEEKQLSSAKSLGKESNVGPTYNTVGSSTGTGEYDSTTGPQGATAPSGAFAGSAILAQGSGVLKPKGANLTEDDNLEGKTKFGEIGTDQDPARVAEQQFAQQDATISGVSKSDLAQGGDSKFSALSTENA